MQERRPSDTPPAKEIRLSTHLYMLPPSVNNLAVRVFLRASGLPFTEENAWG